MQEIIAGAREIALADWRRRFNERAQQYNTSVKTFPTVVLAGMLGFTERAYFQSVTGPATAPKVEF